MRLFFLLLFIQGTLVSQPVSTDSAFVRDMFEKTEVMIPMRDGVKLFTAIYSPKITTVKYPVLLNRTCYGIDPYGKDAYPKSLGPSRHLLREGYIFIYQDVRGRYMSEGTFDNMRPHVKGNDPKNKREIDESSDTYDTITWILKNVRNTNGKVGQWGISYPGFYTAAAIPEAHPALKASSPQAPIADFFFDDFHHNGTFLQSYLMAFPVFGIPKQGQTTTDWYNDAWTEIRKAGNTADGYAFNMGIGSLKNVTEKFYQNDEFWRQTVDHPNYDEFWQQRSILPHLNNVKHAVLTVGGWFDAEDLYGPLNIYKTLEKNNPGIQNRLVMGPWSHGDWARERGSQTVNHIWFGDSISTFYQKTIEKNFFNYYLKNDGSMTLPEAYLFDTGSLEWNMFDQWPPSVDPVILSFHPDGRLGVNEAPSVESVFSYTSDPSKPVPYRSETEGLVFTPRKYMTDDQRHASNRPDVLTFRSDELTTDLTLKGEIAATLEIILQGAAEKLDADFIVKLVDVFPDDAKAPKGAPNHIVYSGYQMLVRSEVFRGRFRNSFAKPEPFENGKPATVDFALQDVLHTFRKGHRVMIQVHSTWFPLFDRNPQKWVDNIYKAENSDFIPVTVSVKSSSSVRVGGRGLNRKEIPKE